MLRFLYNFETKHPFKSFHTLIDYEMAMIMMPLGILGILIGDIIFSILPMFIIATLNCFVWVSAAIQMFTKYIRLLKQENQIMKLNKGKFLGYKKYHDEKLKRDINGFITDETDRLKKLKIEDQKQSPLNPEKSFFNSQNLIEDKIFE